MRVIRPLMLLILFLGIVRLATAQEDEKWYYAYQSSTGFVMAFNANGETNILIDGGVTAVDMVRRLDTEAVFVTLTKSDTGSMRMENALNPNEQIGEIPPNSQI